jgi:geranylgeranyl pyrophosphate synthase
MFAVLKRDNKLSILSHFGKTTILVSKHRENYFYRQLVPFLVEAYPGIEYPKATDLGQCALGYFRVLLIIDNLIDSKDDIGRQSKILFEAVELHELVIRQLCRLINAQSSEVSNEFWTHFDQLKKPYVQTVLSEKEFSITQENFSEQSFEKLAYGKSAICGAIVHGLQALCPTKANILKIEKILEHIHIAFQYLDDIADFKKDIDEHQWTYPQVLLRSYFEQQSLNVEDAATRYKYLFLSGIAQDLVQKAVQHYEQATTLAHDLTLLELKQYLEKQKEAALFYEKEISYLLEKTNQKARKSNTFKADNTLTNTIENSIKYLTQQAEEGFWTDFMTSAGRGKTWISGYVGWQLAQFGFEIPLLKKVLLNLSNEGAYNEQVLQDADSTTFLVGFHQMLNGVVPSHLTQNWLNFQNQEGSWATYRDEATLRKTLDLDAEIGVHGWLSGHCCVSAAAALVLSQMPDTADAYQKTVDYLIASAKNDSLSSYWWTSDVYTQAFTLLALCKKKGNLKIKDKLVKAIIEQQTGSSCWLNPADGLPNAFYTALALKAILAHNPQNQQLEIEGAAKWLQNHQTTDGSWQTSRILRIPATDVLNPATVTTWRNSSFGVNALSDDYNRVFTTATVVNALSEYQKLVQP